MQVPLNEKVYLADTAIASLIFAAKWRTLPPEKKHFLTKITGSAIHECCSILKIDRPVFLAGVMDGTITAKAIGAAAEADNKRVPDLDLSEIWLLLIREALNPSGAQPVPNPLLFPGVTHDRT